MRRHALSLHGLSIGDHLASKESLGLLWRGHTAENEEAIHAAPVAKKDVRRQVVTNHEKIVGFNILQAVLPFKQIETPRVRFPHDRRLKLLRKAGWSVEPTSYFD